MKKHAARVSLIVIEVLAIVLAAGAAGAAYLYWRLDKGPVSLNLFRASALAAIERQLPSGFTAEISGVQMSRAGDRDLLRIDIADLRITDAAGEDAAAAPNIHAVFGMGDLFAGRVGPRTITAKGARFQIVRNAEQNVEIPIINEDPAPKTSPALSFLLDGDLLKSAFESAELVDAEVRFRDIASGRSWVAPGASVSVMRNDTGLVASLAGDIDMTDVRASLTANATYTEHDEIIDIDINGVEFPVGDILTVFYGDNAAVVDAPVSGLAKIRMSASGDIIQSSLNGQIDAGTLNLFGEAAPIELISWRTDFDPAINRFDVSEFTFDVAGSQGSISGVVGISFGEDVRKPTSIAVDLQSPSMTIDPKSFLPEPITAENIVVSGAYDLTERQISVSEFAAEFLDIGVAGDMAFIFPDKDMPAGASIGVKANLTMDGALDPERLLRIWPYRLASGARDWARDRLLAATISNLDFVMDLEVDAVKDDGGLPDDSMLLTFDVNDAAAEYVKGMTPLRNGFGQGELRGNSFLLKVGGATVKEAKVTSGSVEFPFFIPKHQQTFIRFDIEGASETLLDIIDEQPLAFLTKVDLSPAQFAGQAKASAVIMRPNKRDVPQEDYEFSGRATFDSMTVNNLIKDVELTDANGVIDLVTEKMIITGQANLAEEVLDIIWKQNLDRSSDPSEFKVSGTVDSGTADLFGVRWRQNIRGPVEFVANAKGEIGRFEDLTVEADFADASLTFLPLGWGKPAGVPASGSVTINYQDNAINISNIQLDGGGAEVKGAATIGRKNGVVNAAFPTFKLEGAADLNLRADRDEEGRLAVTALGKYLNIGPAIAGFLEGGGDGESGAINWGDGLSVVARIDQIDLRKEVSYKVAALDFWRDADRLQRIDFTAFDENNAPLQIGLQHTGANEGTQSVVEAETGAIGSLLNGILGIESIDGGEGRLTVELSAPGEKSLSGVMEARGLNVSKAPLLARLFAVGSLEGLDALMNGKGIDFDYAYSEFEFSNGVLDIKDARATGSSVGITADGGVAMARGGEISLVGALAPFYQINSILGSAPIIGDILVGKKGEGIFALSYSINGAPQSPTVMINPLSALTPGVFRQLFQLPASSGATADPEIAPEDSAPAE